jgi:hypothetical protein
MQRWTDRGARSKVVANLTQETFERSDARALAAKMTGLEVSIGQINKTLLCRKRQGMECDCEWQLFFLHFAAVTMSNLVASTSALPSHRSWSATVIGDPSNIIPARTVYFLKRPERAVERAEENSCLPKGLHMA